MKEIKTDTIYTEEKVKRFLKFYYFDKLKKVRIILNILILLVIINFFTKYNRSFIDIISFIFALIGILELNTNFLPWFNFLKLKKKKDNIINTKVSYIFKKNNFKLTTDKDEYIDYNILLKIVEPKEDFYLYINNSRSLILGKDNLSNEELESLTKIFKEKVSTYINKNV